MVTHDQPGDGWTAVLRRRPARIVDGRPEGSYTDAFELICNRGDDPGRDYCKDAPGLQRVRGPCTIRTGLAAYKVHLSLNHPGRDASRPMLAEWR